jgi:CRISPR/Cas system-associated protein Cas10 (large subunit of type III CRISPR-Cas system)
MHDYQSLMGEVHDADVMLETMATFAATHKKHNLQSAIEVYENRHQLAATAYINNRDAVTRYWRNTPQTPFPWQKPAKTNRQIKTSKVGLASEHSTS